MEIGFRNLKEGIVDLRNKQATRQTFFATGKVAVPSGGQASISFVPDEDADLAISGLVGSVVAPSNAQGYRVAGATLWPVNPLYPANGYAERGLILQIFDGKSGLQLTDPEPDKWEVNLGFNPLVNVKDFLQPGYQIGAMSEPQVFRYYLRRGNKLVFKFYNRDTAVQAGDPVFHTVAVTLSGRKVMVGTN